MASGPRRALALAFHQAVLDDRDALTATISRLRELAQDGDYAYYIDIASFIVDLPQSPPCTLRRNGWRVNTPPTHGGANSSPPGAITCALPGEARTGPALVSPAGYRVCVALLEDSPGSGSGLFGTAFSMGAGLSGSRRAMPVAMSATPASVVATRPGPVRASNWPPTAEPAADPRVVARAKPDVGFGMP